MLNVQPDLTFNLFKNTFTPSSSSILRSPSFLKLLYFLGYIHFLALHTTSLQNFISLHDLEVTLCEGELLGLFLDGGGHEQDSVNSSDFYKILGKEQLMTAQDSAVVSALGITLLPNVRPWSPALVKVLWYPPMARLMTPC